MSAAAVGLSRNSRTAMGGFHPPTIAAGGKTAGSVKQGTRAEAPAGPGRHTLRLEPSWLMRSPGPGLRGRRRAGGRFLLPLAALRQTRPLDQLEAGVNPRGPRARGRGGTGGLAGRGVPIAARQPGVREILEA
jgi:hypothetical protein